MSQTVPLWVVAVPVCFAVAVCCYVVADWVMRDYVDPCVRRKINERAERALVRDAGMTLEEAKATVASWDLDGDDR